LTKHELQPYAKHIQEATSREGWHVLRSSLGHITVGLRKIRLNSAEKDHAAIDELTAVFESAEAQVTLIEAYLKAYFLNGKFVSLDVDAGNMQASILQQLKKKFPKLPDAEVDKLVAKVLRQLTGVDPVDGKYKLLAKLKDGGYVTRGGAKYAFPGVSISVDLTADQVVQASKVDFTQVGSDIVRIAIEATGDALAQLPVDPSSTACEAINAKTLKDYSKLRCYGRDNEQVTVEEFAKVNDRAGKVETYVATATGQVIRGISWLSLNNEALAKLIETAVGVFARKAAEKVTWCVYACNGKDPGTDSSAEEEFKTLSVQIRGAGTN